MEQSTLLDLEIIVTHLYSQPLDCGWIYLTVCKDGHFHPLHVASVHYAVSMRCRYFSLFP